MRRVLSRDGRGVSTGVWGVFSNMATGGDTPTKCLLGTIQSMTYSGLFGLHLAR
jgi:hypothetical protein